ncbi:peptidase M16, partial [Staphylococcus pseudintermedius]
FTGDPGCFRTSLANIEKASAADLSRLGAQWLDKGSHTLVIAPGERVALKEDPSQAPKPFNVPAVDPKYSTLPEQADRKAGVPQTREFPQLKFPALQRATLKHGTQV